MRLPFSFGPENSPPVMERTPRDPRGVEPMSIGGGISRKTL